VSFNPVLGGFLFREQILLLYFATLHQLLVMFFNDLIISIIAIIYPLFMLNDPVPQHNSILTGELYYHELIYTLNDARFLNAVRMDKPTFFRLLSHLKTTGMLRDSISISAGQKVMILIHALTGHSNRESAERWQHSGSSISAIIHEVVEAMYECTKPSCHITECFGCSKF